MTSTLSHDRSLRLFQFLREFTQLKAKPQRTNDSYTVLWLHDVPNEPEIDNAARRENQDTAPEVWLSVRKPKLPAAPELPDELLPWVTARIDDYRIPPQPLRERLVTATVKDDDLRDVEIRDTLFFDQQPELLALWETYLGRWQRWAAGDRRARAVQDVYSRLFALHQNLSTFEETYELHLGLGYLSWKPQDKDEVRRHLLVARAALHFDPLRGVLTVSAGPDGARTALEQDMLERELRPPVEVQQAIERALEDGGEDLWNAQTLPDLLETWVNALSASGSYSPDLQPPRSVGPQPTVTLAPALMMRKRGERSLGKAYGEILEQVKEQTEAPINLAPFLGNSAAPASRSSDQNHEPGPRPELYFPLPANAAQREIIERLNRQPGVLVQGPPGTGKSHTIVNLVSHLLATNQRVLVTSHTARALKVLREKFPPELAALCVTYLRGEEGAKGTLERSVGELLQRANHRDERQEQHKLDSLASQLEQLRQEETQLLDTLRDFRKSETQTLSFFGYAGSAQVIAQSLKEQENGYDWLENLAEAQRDVPLSDAEALHLLELRRSFTPEETRELSQSLPELNGLPEPQTFAGAVHAEQQARQREQAHTAARLHPHYALLEGASAQPTDRLPSGAAGRHPDRPAAGQSLGRRGGGRGAARAGQQMARRAGGVGPASAQGAATGRPCRQSGGERLGRPFTPDRSG